MTISADGPIPEGKELLEIVSKSDNAELEKLGERVWVLRNALVQLQPGKTLPEKDKEKYNKLSNVIEAIRVEQRKRNIITE
jgi:hypothetical protein